MQFIGRASREGDHRCRWTLKNCWIVEIKVTHNRGRSYGIFRIVTDTDHKKSRRLEIDICYRYSFEWKCISFAQNFKQQLMSTFDWSTVLKHYFDILPLHYIHVMHLATSHFTDSHDSVFIGCYLWCVTSRIMLWAGHCVRGCCIRAKEAHF